MTIHLATTLCICLGTLLLRSATALTLPRDVFALKVIFDEMYGTHRKWTELLDTWPIETCNFTTGVCDIDPCGLEWQGNGWDGVSCRYQDPVGHPEIPLVITNFHVPDKNLSGPLPKSIIHLADLTEFDGDSNDFNGTLPEEWACLPYLLEIDISNNKIEGTIPKSWASLKYLYELEVDGNWALEGCAPSELPDFSVKCGPGEAVQCPKYKESPNVIGIDAAGTQLKGRCKPIDVEEAVADLVCPTPEDTVAQALAGGALVKKPSFLVIPRGTMPEEQRLAMMNANARRFMESHYVMNVPMVPGGAAAGTISAATPKGAKTTGVAAADALEDPGAKVSGRRLKL